MSTIPKLPIEVVDLVVCNTESNGDLCSFALSSRVLHKLVVPHLYRHVLMRRFTRDDEKVYTKLRKLGVTLLKNAHIAACVRGFSLHELDNGSNSEPIPEVDLEDEYQVAIRASSRTTQEAHEWRTRLQGQGNMDALLTLLLPLLPRLEQLELAICTYPWSYFEAMMRRAAANEKPFDTKPSFSALKQFTYSYHDRGLGCPYRDHYFKLPALEAIHTSNMGWFCPKLRPTSSNVRHLELRNCHIPESLLLGMLCACKALKTFIYETHVRRAWNDQLKKPEIRSALASFRDTLENLWVNYKIGPDGFMVCLSGDIDSPVSFAGLHNLKHLKIGVPILFGDHLYGNMPIQFGNHLDHNRYRDLDPTTPSIRLARRLPISLRRLHMIHCNGDTGTVLRHLEQLLRDKQDLPLLNEVLIEAPVNGNWNQGNCSRLEALAKSVGVNIEWLDSWAEYGMEGWPYGLVRRGWGMDGEIAWMQPMEDVGSDTE